MQGPLGSAVAVWVKCSCVWGLHKTSSCCRSSVIQHGDQHPSCHQCGLTMQAKELVGVLLPAAAPNITYCAPNLWTCAASTALCKAERACWPCSSELKWCQVWCIFFNPSWLVNRNLGQKEVSGIIKSSPPSVEHKLAQHPCPAPSSQQFGLLPSLLALNSCSQSCCTNGCHCCLICSQIHSCPI